MEKKMHDNLMGVINSLINDDAEAGAKAFHEYSTAKAREIILGEKKTEKADMVKDEEDMEDKEDKDEEDMDDKEDKDEEDMEDKEDKEDKDEEDMEDKEDKDEEDMEYKKKKAKKKK